MISCLSWNFRDILEGPISWLTMAACCTSWSAAPRRPRAYPRWSPRVRPRGGRSWSSPRRPASRSAILLRLAEVLRVGIEELTGSADRNETGRPAHPAVPLIEQAMMGYGAPGPAGGDEEPGREVSLDFQRTGTLCVPGLSGDPLRRSGPYPARTDPRGRNGSPDRPLGQPGRLRGPRSGLRHHGRAAEPRGRAIPGLGSRRSGRNPGKFSLVASRTSRPDVAAAAAAGSPIGNLHDRRLQRSCVAARTPIVIVSRPA